ncbi:MAG: DUF2225 domain-containing protein [Lachnospiraceae bacterium]|nr:DUF2225 domain-containing protein [Lachnospiraceae bacterium]
MEEIRDHEEDYLLDKKYECTVCANKFTSRSIKSARVRMIGTDDILRQQFEQLDTHKYDVVVCPRCGYATVSKFFGTISDRLKPLIKEKIAPQFNYEEPAGAYSYNDAIRRYKIALTNIALTKGKDSEKAYLCLKLAWVMEGKEECLNPEAANYADQKERCDMDLKGAIKLARDSFIAARAGEEFPIAGMDENTLDYLISALSVRLEDYNTASKLLSNIITSRGVNPRLKDKARDLMGIVKKNFQEEAEE